MSNKDKKTHTRGRLYIDGKDVLDWMLHGATQEGLKEVEKSLTTKIEKAEIGLREEIGDVRQELRKETGLLRQEIRSVETGLRQEIIVVREEGKSNFKWLIGTMVTLFVTMIGVIMVK